ncbi:DUF2567 domain-containing protein [Dactylosporangium sp. NPDC051484]|uniref:DUF2567 domain-containing protein n=1 Tax=Dactylosporangium sp. NPDC051484 TaxID=3154942 RepID=UPI00344B091A
MSVAPISPVEEPEASGPAREPIGREVLSALVVAVVIAGLGAPFGLLWAMLAPNVELVQTQYGPYPVEGEPEGYWADDGWFILMSLAMGALIAVVAWLLLRRYRGPIVLAALVVGSAGASVLGAWLGNKVGWAHYIDLAESAPVGTHMFRPVKLRTGTSSLLFGFIPWVRGTLLVQALAAGAVYTGLAGFHASPTLRYDNMPVEYLDQPAGPYPTASHPDQPQPGVGDQPGPAHPGSPSPGSFGPPAPASFGLPGSSPASSGQLADSPDLSVPALPPPGASWADPGAPPSPEAPRPDAPSWPGPGSSFPPVAPASSHQPEPPRS